MTRAFLILLLTGVFTMANASTDGTQLVQTWHIQYVYDGETPVAPAAALAGDMFQFNAGETFSAVINGVAYTGTYALHQDAGWVTMYITDDHAERYKIVELTATTLKVQQFLSDGTIRTLQYTAG